MQKQFISFLVFFALTFSGINLFGNGIIRAQNNHSIQINGGVISPMSSSKGLSIYLQYNYYLNRQIILYTYTGYS
ncbi:MAG: hypothetical protein WBV81_00650, partial [Ignavibacteriaceae bacterium]